VHRDGAFHDLKLGGGLGLSPIQRCPPSVIGGWFVGTAWLEKRLVQTVVGQV